MCASVTTPNIFDLMNDNKELRLSYGMLKGVEIGRKIGTDKNGRFFQSTGFNTGVLSLSQSVSRTCSNAMGHDATSIGTKNALEQLNKATLLNLENLRGYYERIGDRVPNINQCLQTHLIALKEVVGLAKRSISNLVETYALEKDKAMTETTKTEVETCTKIENLIIDFTKMLEKEDFSNPSNSSDSEKPMPIPADSPKALKVMKNPPTKKMKPLIDELKSRLEYLQDDHNSAKDSFLSMFEKVGTLEEMEDLNAYFEEKKHTLSSDFVKLLETMKHSAKIGLKLCLSKAIRNKKVALESPTLELKSVKKDFITELLEKTKVVEAN